MSLNIKSKEAHELAAELARLSGKSMTAVVTEALRHQLAQHRRRQNKEQRLAELLAIGRRCADHIHEPVSSVEHGALLYDDQGLPL
jgi:antitoxin VapB